MNEVGVQRKGCCSVTSWGCVTDFTITSISETVSVDDFKAVAIGIVIRLVKRFQYLPSPWAP